MRVLRSRRSLPAAPPETSALSPEPFSPPITDSSQNISKAAATTSSGTIFRRFSLRLANKISSQVTVAADECAIGKRRRTSNVSVVGCSSVSRENGPLQQLQSGLLKPNSPEPFTPSTSTLSQNNYTADTSAANIKSELLLIQQQARKVTSPVIVMADEGASKRKRSFSVSRWELGTGTDHCKTEVEMVLSFNQGDLSDRAEEGAGLPSKHESGCAEGLARDAEGDFLKEEENREKTGEMHLSFQKEGDYMSLRSGSRVLKKKIGDEGNDSPLFSKGLDRFLSRRVQNMKCLSPHSECIEKFVDTNLNDSPLFTELADGRSFCKEKKTGDELVVELGNFGRQDEGSRKLVLQDPLLNESEIDKGKEKLAPKEFEVTEEEQATKIEIEFNNVNALRELKSGGSQRMVMSRRETDRNIATELAPKFALFKSEEEEIDEEVEDDSMLDTEEDDWPGPFSTALKIIEERESILRARSLNYSSHNAREVKIPWTPNEKLVYLGKPTPSLKDLCLKVLCDNSEEIESLEGLPDAIKNNIALLLCHSRKMSFRVLHLLTKGSPMEIYLSDCSWMTEKQFEEVFSRCNIDGLKVLQLDFCGRCLPDYVLCSTISRAPNCLSSLNKLSLKGAYCLSDSGIDAIVASAPFLKSLNLSQCSLITSKGIISVAEKLKLVLQELYIDVCPNVDAMLILPALNKLQCLEVLSVALLETVTDKFLKNLIPVSGPKMRGLIIAGCRKLTNASLKIIGENCPRLSYLDIQNLNRLNDSAIEHLANGGCPFQTLKICHSAFSDEALAAFIEASGATLLELVLNNIEKAAGNTALAISRRCSLSLRSLDLSFCRNMTDEALGVIVDSCSNLRVLKLFGCTQVTNFFLKGHSNSLVKIIGLKGSILDEIEVPDFS